jgi:hypothetical protein
MLARSAILILLLGAGAGAALAQAPAAPDEGRRNQKVQRIQIEDGGNRIDEVRYGGQTQSITVQPKAGVPEYEVDPGSLARTRPADSREGLSATGGQRSWNLFRF